MKIVVTGSLGNVGRPLTIDLIQKGHHVTVISSKPDKIEPIEALGAVAAIGKLEEADFLVSAFTGADAVYAIIPPNFAALDQIDYYRRIAAGYADAIKQSGVACVVHQSSYGAHLEKGTGFIAGSYHAERILSAVPGLSVTHLRPTYFYTNLYNFSGMISNAGHIASNYGGADHMAVVHPRDIAAVAAEALTQPAAERNIRYVASDELTAQDIAAALGKAIGKPDLQWSLLSDEQLRETLQNSGVPPHLVANFVEIGAATHSGILRQDYEKHKPALGSVKMVNFAQEFASVFRQTSHGGSKA